MSVIHIARNRQPLGHFSQGDVVEGLKSGRFLPTDLGWQEPMETWKPLSEFDLSSIEDVAEPVVEMAFVPEPPVPSAPPEPAWEQREEIGYLTASFRTIRQIWLEPAATFRNLEKTGGYLGPLMFCYPISVVCYLIGVLFAVSWFFVLPTQALAFYREDSLGGFLQHQAISVPIMLGGYVILPFMMAGLYHLILMLLAKTRGNYEVTFRAYSYLSGALAIAGAFPVPPFTAAIMIYAVVFVGIFVAYLTIALREAHQTTTVIALICTILPPLFLSCCCAFAAGLGSTAAVMAAKGVAN